MRLWDQRILPRLTDVSLRGRYIDELREQACAGLAGKVLELGFGSGLNTRFYPAEVRSVDAVEPSDAGWRISEQRRRSSPVPVRRLGLDGESVDADDQSYDAVLSTFTLCTIPDVEKALSEVRRVLRPGGNLHFLEHGRAPTARVHTWQRRLEPLQKRVCGGCHLTRDMPALISGAGLAVDGVTRRYLPGPGASRPWTYVYLGRAHRP